MCLSARGCDDRKVFLVSKATRAEVPRIMEIRAAVRENKLRDPSRVTLEDVIGSSIIPAFSFGKKTGGLLDFQPPTRAMAASLRYSWMRLTRGAASAEFCSTAPVMSW